MNKIRLAIVRQKYRPDGGAERFISRALEALDSEQLDLNIITRSWQGAPNPAWHLISATRQSLAASPASAVLHVQRAPAGSGNSLTLFRVTSASPGATFFVPATAYIGSG